MQLNYFGALKLILAFLPGMRERKSGHIVNVSSIGVQTNTPRFSAYVASKSALDAFSRCVAPEVIGDNVNFTTVYMPLVRTPMIAPTDIYKAFPTLTPEEAAQMLCDAMIDKPKRMASRLGTFGEVLYSISPKTRGHRPQHRLQPLPRLARRQGQEEEGRQGRAEAEQKDGEGKDARRPTRRCPRRPWRWPTSCAESFLDPCGSPQRSGERRFPSPSGERRAALDQVRVDRLLDRLAHALGELEHERAVVHRVRAVAGGLDRIAELDPPLRRAAARAPSGPSHGKVGVTGKKGAPRRPASGGTRRAWGRSPRSPPPPRARSARPCAARAPRSRRARSAGAGSARENGLPVPLAPSGNTATSSSCSSRRSAL